MKKIFAILTLAIASICGSASAENWYAGGSLGFWHSSKEGTNQLVIMPELGYNFNSSWAFGSKIGYDYTNYFRLHKTWNGLFKIEPYARWTYFRTDNNLVQLFVDGGFGLGIGSSNSGGHSADTALSYNIGLRPGVAFNFTKRFSVVARLGFLGYKGCNDALYDAGGERAGGFGFSTEDIMLGFYYNF